MVASGTVGTVNIRVKPEFANFKKNVRKYMETVEKEFRKNPLKITVAPDFDKAEFEKVREQAQKAVGDVKANVEASIDKASLARVNKTLETLDNARTAEVAVRVDRVALRSAIDSIESDLNTSKNLVAQLKITTDQGEIEELRRTIKHQLDKTHVRLEKLDIDSRAVKQAAQQLNDIGELIKIHDIELDREAVEKTKQQLQHEFDDVEVDVKADADTKAAALKLEWLTRLRTVTIHATLTGTDKVATQLAALSGLRVLKDVGDNLRDFAENIDRISSKAALISTGLMALGASALNAGAGVINFGAGLAKAAKAGIALPGIMSGAAVATAAFAMGLGDIGKRLGDIGERFKEMQDQVSNAFWTEAEAPIRRLADETLPLVTQKMVELGTATGAVTGAFADAVRESATVGHLSELFDNTRDAVELSATGVKDMTYAIGELSTVGSRQLPRLAAWFNELSAQFKNFISEAAASGELEQWIEQGIQGLKDLGKVIKNTTRVFSGLYKATNTAGTGMAGLVDLTERMADVVNSPAFQTGLSTVLEGAREGADQLADGIYNVGAALGNMAPLLSSSFDAFGQSAENALNALADVLNNSKVQTGIANLVGGFTSMVDTLAERLPSLSPLIGDLLTFMGQMADTVGSVLGSALTALAPAFEAVIEAATPLVEVLGEELTGVFDWLAPKIEAIAPILRDVLGQAFSWLAEKVQEASQAIQNLDPAKLQDLKNQAIGLAGIAGAVVSVAALAQAFTSLGTAASTVSGALAGLQAIPAMLGGVSAGMLGIVAGITAAFVGMVAASDNLRASLGELFSSLMPLLQPLGELLSTIGGAVWELLAVLGDALAPVISGLAAVIEPIAMMITDIANAALPVLQSGLDILLPVLETVGGILGGALGVALQAIGTVLSALWPVLEPIITGFLNLLNTVLQPLADFITGTLLPVWDNLKTKVSEVWGTITGWIGEKITNIRETISTKVEEIKTKWSETWEKVKTKVSEAWERVKSTVSEKIGNVVEFVRSLPGKAANALSNLGATIKEKAVSAWETFKSAVSTGITNAVNTVRELPSKIIGALGNVGQMLYESGRSILQGLWDGIWSKVQWVKDKIGGALSSIRNLFPFSPAKEGPFSGKGWVLYSGLSIGEAMGEGIERSMVNAVGAAQKLAAQTSNALTIGQQLGIEPVDSTTYTGVNPFTGGDVYNVSVNVDAKDLRDINDVAQFVDMLSVYTRMGVTV